MGRSKKNWDHLVDYYGNYAIDIKNGQWPGSGNSPGYKGNKGEVGWKGEKGTGAKGTKGDLGSSGLEGGKGEIGPSGQKGPKGDAEGLLFFQGSKDDVADLPTSGNILGHSWYVKGDDEFYVWDGNEWIPINGVNDIQGEKGETGDQGLKGDAGKGGNPGPGGQDGDKGEKGEPYDPLVLDDYYTKGQVEFLIEDLEPPEYAFHTNFNSQNSSRILTGSVDFMSMDQNNPVYDIGLVTIGQRVTIQNCPVVSNRLMVVNYVVEDNGDSRGDGYTLLQHVFNGSPSETDYDAAYRRVRPAQNEFGAWRRLHFDDNNYYTKQETHQFESKHKIVAATDTLQNSSQIRLLDDAGNQPASHVAIQGINGIGVNYIGNRIVIDGDAVSGSLMFMGIIKVSEDPANILTVPAVRGMYFIFEDEGVVAINAETASVGDWLLYDADDEWHALPFEGNYGVVEVELRQDESYMVDIGTTQRPVLGVDTLAWNRDFPMAESAAREAKSDYLSGLSDVSIPRSSHGPTLTWGKRVLSEEDVDGSSEADPGGRVYTHYGLSTILFEKTARGDANATAWWDSFQSGDWHQVELLGSQDNVQVKVIAKVENANHYYVLYENSIVISQFSLTGEVTITPFKDHSITNGHSLFYNATTEKWVPDEPVTKEWVLEELAKIAAVPVGSVMFWASSSGTPDGWFVCAGSSFDRNKYPKLNAVIVGMHGGTSGKLPDWRGHFLHHTNGVDYSAQNGGRPGQKITQSTANSTSGVSIPDDTGKHKHTITSNLYINKDNKTNNQGPKQNYMRGDHESGSATSLQTGNNQGGHTHAVEGFDAKTRPTSVAGYWIIKAD